MTETERWTALRTEVALLEEKYGFRIGAVIKQVPLTMGDIQGVAQWAEIAPVALPGWTEPTSQT